MSGGGPRALHLETDASGVPDHPRRVPGVPWSVRAGAGIVLREAVLGSVWLPGEGKDGSGYIGPVVASYAVSLGTLPSSWHAEFLAFELGLRKALEQGATGLLARSDLLGLVRAVNGEATTRAPGSRATLDRILALKARFDSFTVRWAKSTHDLRRKDGAFSADTLAKIGSGALRPARIPPEVKLERYNGEGALDILGW